MKEITDEEFDAVITSGKVLVAFSSTWCQPCKAIEPMLEKLSVELSEITFVKLDIDEQPINTSRHNVSCVPTLVLFEDGEEAKRHLGAMPMLALRAWLGV